MALSSGPTINFQGVTVNQSAAVQLDGNGHALIATGVVDVNKIPHINLQVASVNPVTLEITLTPATVLTDKLVGVGPIQVVTGNPDAGNIDQWVHPIAMTRLSDTQVLLVGTSPPSVAQTYPITQPFGATASVSWSYGFKRWACVITLTPDHSAIASVGKLIVWYTDGTSTVTDPQPQMNLIANVGQDLSGSQWVLVLCSQGTTSTYPVNNNGQVDYNNVLPTPSGTQKQSLFLLRVDDPNNISNQGEYTTPSLQGAFEQFVVVSANHILAPTGSSQQIYDIGVDWTTLPPTVTYTLNNGNVADTHPGYYPDAVVPYPPAPTSQAFVYVRGGFDNVNFQWAGNKGQRFDLHLPTLAPGGTVSRDPNVINTDRAPVMAAGTGASGGIAVLAWGSVDFGGFALKALKTTQPYGVIAVVQHDGGGGLAVFNQVYAEEWYFSGVVGSGSYVYGGAQVIAAGVNAGNIAGPVFDVRGAVLQVAGIPSVPIHKWPMRVGRHASFDQGANKLYVPVGFLGKKAVGLTPPAPDTPRQLAQYLVEVDLGNLGQVVPTDELVQQNTHVSVNMGTATQARSYQFSLGGDSATPMAGFVVNIPIAAYPFKFGYQPWFNIGGGVAGTPAVAATFEGNEFIFVRGNADNKLYYRYQHGPVLDAWTPLPGITLASDPCAVVEPIAALGTTGYAVHVFAVGTDGQLWQITRSALGVWGSWTARGGSGLIAGVGKGPAAACLGQGKLDVYVCTTVNQIWRYSWRSNAWTLTNLGFYGDGRLGAFGQVAANTPTVYLTSTQAAGNVLLYALPSGGPTGTITNLGGTTPSKATLVGWQPPTENLGSHQSLDVLCAASGGGLYRKHYQTWLPPGFDVLYPTTGWSNWVGAQALGPGIAAGTGVGIATGFHNEKDLNGRQYLTWDVFACAANGSGVWGMSYLGS